ncbi:MAG TPA: methyltransferase domain-containing protein [Pyrinomonadaceae bacterium]|nr:methyltransferase domain-containing protein [Pyrinomonadaceae bacterium]
MFPSFRRRSEELEHIDTGDYTPEEYEGALVELTRVNRWLGDGRAVRLSVLPLIERDGAREFALLDVGAGSGELLRQVAAWAAGESRGARLVGLDLNLRSAKAILEGTRDSGEVSAVRGDALRLPFADRSFDYVMCSLFAHHFKDEPLVAVMREMARVARRRVFVVDLHRHPVAYYFYTTALRAVLHNRLVREDGALSILRGFRPRELRELARRAGLARCEVRRRFPYRLVLSADVAAKV